MNLIPIENNNTTFSAHEADDVFICPEAWDVSFILTGISNALANHSKLYELGIKDTTFKLAVVTNRSVMEKFKPQDPDTQLTRLRYILNLFDPMMIEFNWCIFVGDNKLEFQSPEVSTSLWPLKYTWQGGNYIMMRDYIVGSIDPETHRFGFPIRGTDTSYYRKYAEDNNLEIVTYNYDTPFEEIISKMLTARFVVSDYSGLSAFAIFLGCPLIVVSDGDLNMFFAGQKRPISFGSGNITMDGQLDHIEDNKIKQKYYNGPIYNISTNNCYVPEGL